LFSLSSFRLDQVAREAGEVELGIEGFQFFLQFGESGVIVRKVAGANAMDKQFCPVFAGF
jgi:hypothetical protein